LARGRGLRLAATPAAIGASHDPACSLREKDGHAALIVLLCGVSLIAAEKPPHIGR